MLLIGVGGLIILRPLSVAPLQLAATAAFLSKVYNDYLDILHSFGGSCGNQQSFSLQMLHDFSTSQASCDEDYSLQCDA